MIKPTVGRKLHYYPIVDQDNRCLDGGLNYQSGQPIDANIVYVHGDNCINIAGFDHNGKQFARTSVRLVQDDEPELTPDTGYCKWMPYQVGQAKAAS
jgi:hypothetical protein